MQKKENKEKLEIELYRYDPQIYPRKLWISFPKDDGEAEIICKEFNAIEDNAPLCTPKMRTADGCTYNGIRKIDTGDHGVLIILNLKRARPGIVVHEAFHAMTGILDDLGETNRADECRAYLIEWVVDCIEDAKTMAKKKLKSQKVVEK